MAKQLWKPGNMIYPLPAVMVSVTDGEGHDNIITVAWTGTVCTNPAMAYISVRPSRYSYDMIRKTGEFVINLTTEKLAFATEHGTSAITISAACSESGSYTVAS